jgi:hypothetical protein
MNKLAIKSLRNEMALINKEFKQPELGKIMLETLKPYALDFRELVESFKARMSAHSGVTIDSSARKKEFEIFLKQEIGSNPYFIWINEQPSFREAKNIMTEQGLLPFDNNIKSMNEFYHFYLLEGILSVVIDCASDEKALSNVKNTKKRREVLKLITKLSELLDSPIPSFFMERTLKHILDLILEDERYFIASGKNHPDLMREFLANTTMQQLFRSCGTDKLNHTLAANIAVNLMTVFFEEIDLSRAGLFAKEIKELVGKYKQMSHAFYSPKDKIVSG